MSVRRSLFVLAIVAVLMPIFFFNAPDTDGDTTQRQNLQLYEVRTGDVTRSVSAIGALTADQTISLSFLTAGRVRQIYAQRDDYVLADDPLIELDNTAQRLAYEQALISLERAELNLEDTLTIDPNRILIAQASVDSARGALTSITNAVSNADLQAAELAYQQALASLDIAIEERDRAPASQYVTRDAQVGEASFNAEIARLQLEQLRTATAPQANTAYNAVLQAQAELERVRAGATPFEIEAATIAIRQAQTQLDRARIAFDRTILRAPFDGVVASLNLEEGALVAPGLPAVELTKIDPLRLIVQVDEIDIGLISVGLPARVELDALQGTEYPATVASIAPVGTTEGGIVSYEVEITLQDIDPRARVGMTAEATIIIEEVTSVISLPNLYIRIDRTTNQAFVNVIDQDGNLEEVPVQLGLRGQDVSQIVSGLTEGQLVAVQLGGSGLATFIGN